MNTSLSELLPCYCHGEDLVPYCPRHSPLPGEENEDDAAARDE